MPKYKITASKSQKKYIFVLNTENEKLAKKRIHKEGYSILGIELFDDSKISRNTFIFKAKKNGETKNGKVIGEDIFKIYLKLVDGIGYDVLKLYSDSDKEKPKEYKENILKDLKEQYSFYQNNNEKYKQAKKEEKSKIKVGKNEVNIDNFYLKKELEETNKLIDFVLKKLKNLLENEKYKIDDLKKEKLKKLYNSLIKIKSSTNINKLKQIGELILLKVGEIELKTLEKFKDKNSKKYLSETNKLLKAIGSEKKIITENRDIKKQIRKVLIILKDFFISLKGKEKKTKNFSFKNKDKTSHFYLKNIIFLNKYKQKLRQNNIEILKKFYIFLLPFGKLEEEKQNLTVKRNIIKQNIYLFKAKLQGNVFSYTKTIKGFQFILDSIFQFFNYIKDYLFYVVLFYSLLFLLFLNISYYNILPGFETSLNYNGIFYFIMFIFVYFAIYFSRGVYSMIFNFVILFFILNFGIINF